MIRSKFPPMIQSSWTITRILLLSIGFFLFSQQTAQANYLGADITYTCLGENQYVVNLTLYRDCSGAIMPGQVNIQRQSMSCGLAAVTINLPLDTSFEVSKICPAQLANSTCNGGTLFGVEAYVYSGLVVLPQSCTDWVLSWSACCRDASITNLVSPSTTNRYIEAGINSTICNSSPYFHNAPLFEACDGILNNYNYGAVDVEHDLLFHAMTCPQSAANTCIPFAGTFTTEQPFATDTLHSDTISGQLAFIATAGIAQQIPIVNTIFQLDKNYDTIGYIQRDVDLRIVANANCDAPIELLDVQTTFAAIMLPYPKNFNICAGETLIFDIILHDPQGDPILVDALNTTISDVFGQNNWTIFINTAPPFRADSLQAFISIVTENKQIGLNTIVFSFMNNACPNQGISIFDFNVFVTGVDIKNKNEYKLCPGAVQDIQLSVEAFAPDNVSGGNALGTSAWTQDFGPAITFSNDTILEPIISFPSSLQIGDSIQLRLAYTTPLNPNTGTYCISTDTILFIVDANLGMMVLPNDIGLCPNGVDSLVLSTQFSRITDATNGSFTWTASPSNRLISTTTDAQHQHHLNVLGNAGDSIQLVVDFTLGTCYGTDTLNLAWHPDVVNLSASLDSICSGDTVQLMSSLSNTVYTDVNFNWNPALFLSDAMVNNPIATPQVTTMFQVHLEKEGCVYQDSVKVVVKSDLTPPILTCSNFDGVPNSILFEWGQSVGATAWEYSQDSGATWFNIPLQFVSLLVSNLSNGSISSLWVRAVGGTTVCPNNSPAIIFCGIVDTTVTVYGLRLEANFGGPNATYQWVNCDSSNAPIVGATDQSFTPTSNGNYAVIVSNGGNSMLSDCFAVVVTSTIDLQDDLGLQLFPNPTTGLVQLVKKDASELLVQILDNTGRLLQSKNINSEQSTIDLGDYPSGIYWITLINNKQVITKKIIKN